MTGAKTPPGIPEPKQGIQSQVLQKKSGHWLIQAFQNTNGAPERHFHSGRRPARQTVATREMKEMDRLKGKANPLVSKVHGKEKHWSAEFAALRELCLGLGLNEELKWGQACYDLNGGKVVLIHGFKDYCALLFMKGALLKDPKGILIQQTKNVQSARQIRFTSLAEINKQKTAVRCLYHGGHCSREIRRQGAEESRGRLRGARGVSYAVG